MTQRTAGPCPAQFVQLAAEFDTRLELLKQEIGPPGDAAWYPYESFGAVEQWPELLGEKRTALDFAGGEPVLDLGCGDGALSFFFESLGCEVDAVDLPATNYNGMRGIRKLKDALGSKVAIHEVDLDSQFALPEKTYGLALFIGILYHLKNPFHALEKLSRSTRYCILGTRVAQVTPAGTPMRDEPLAYLVGDEETNSDSTNYWIFSPSGLRLLAVRAGWDVLGFMTAGCKTESNPSDPERDERAFCLIESRMIEPRNPAILLKGWHELENNWRWTEREFAVSCPPGVSEREDTMEFRFHLPPYVSQVTLSARVEGETLRPVTFEGPGEHVYCATVPRELLRGDRMRIEFALDRATPPQGGDLRELGVIVSFYRPGYETRDANLPLRFG